ncbi:MAG: 4Fe-4S dicluster domain-containing protein [Burkholderiaceae bacterium]
MAPADCTLCVQVCPVGIDIRQGLQAACDQLRPVHRRLQPGHGQTALPRGLIRMARNPFPAP